MQLDALDFPIVWMRFKAPSNSPGLSPFEEFEQLLARKQPFVLINDEGLDRSNHEESPEERKQVSLWMKRNKAELRSYVKAAIYIEPSTAKRVATKAFAAIYEKFWGYPMMMAITMDEAVRLANDLLTPMESA
ncbi:hypothetical protein [Stenotrophomonas sp. TWI1409]|uniref:hypothetical protein n=1 Tax=unclassified Stenotrophomonas TaxID=196198 RepID=UPI0032085738